jgi:hypothetical protein
MTFLTEIEKSILTCIRKHKRPWEAKTIQSKKSITGGITMPDFKLSYRAIAVKKAWYWHKNRHKDQWNRTEDSDIYPLIFNKGAQSILWRKESLFNICCWAPAC